MIKNKNIYVCQECGFENSKWFGKCPNCGAWNSLVEETRTTSTDKPLGTSTLINKSSPKCISNIKSGEYERYDTGINELNRILGGGLVKGSLTLISGAPGIGKSTILLQAANGIANRYGKVLYVSGEESDEQIKMRADRLKTNSPNLFILSENNMQYIQEHIENNDYIFVIIDSIQTIFKPELNSAPGSVSQVRECSNAIMRIGKSNNIPFFIVAHVTKMGELAGPKVLEHIVDTVLSFEGERTQEFRILRTVKNRFGTTSEIGVFEMDGEGLKEVANPSGVFLQEISLNSEGSTVIGIMEGTRPILVEIQALATTIHSEGMMPRRTTVGFDLARLNLIVAVLEKKLRIPFYNKDVYVNVVGGLQPQGTFGDLGLALSLISSAQSREFALKDTLVIGEIGLTGEIRPVSFCDRIINEGKKMGFKNIVVPAKNRERINDKDINIIGVSYLKEAVSSVFGKER